MAHNQIIRIPLGLTKVDMGDTVGAELTLETGKGYNGGVRADASVHWVGAGFRRHAFGLGGGGDFSKRIAQTETTVKATQKAIDTLHAQTFTPETIAQIKAAAIAHYPDAQKQTEAA